MDRGDLECLIPPHRWVIGHRLNRSFVRLANGAHEPCGALPIRRSQKQVDMVSHQHISMDGAFEVAGRFAEVFQKREPIPVVEKTLRMAASAAHHVQANPGGMNVGKPRHGRRTAGAARPLTDPPSEG